jgi:hypothetical protein
MRQWRAVGVTVIHNVASMSDHGCGVLRRAGAFAILGDEVSIGAAVAS